MKLYLFGASGSGVTTLGQYLSASLARPYFDSDSFFWEPSVPPFTVKREPAARNAMLEKALAAHDSWILGGSLVSWDLYPAFDLAVFLYLPPEVRMERLKKRELERYGDVIYTDPQRNALYNAFIDWAAGYDNPTPNGRRSLQLHETWMKTLSCPVLEIRGDYSTEERARLIMTKLDHAG